MDKIVYLFSDMKNNPLYVGCGAPNRPLQWFRPSVCHFAAMNGSRFGMWMLENNFSAVWSLLMTNLDFQSSREIEGRVIRSVGTIDEGGPLLNVMRGAGAETRKGIDRDGAWQVRKVVKAKAREAARVIKEAVDMAHDEAREALLDTRLEADQTAARRFAATDCRVTRSDAATRDAADRKLAQVGFTDHQRSSIAKRHR